MLYITTRDKHDVHTANKTLTSNAAADGGLYLPRSMPRFSAGEIAELRNKTFSETFANVLNCFFTEQSTSRDVELFIGKNPVKVVPIGRKILVAQTWHNPERMYAYIENNIYKKLCKGSASNVPTDWLKISVRIALIFSVYGQLLQTSMLHIGKPFDMAVDSDDNISVVATFFAKQMGLPVGKLICGCDETGAFWDLVHLGEISTAAASAGLVSILERLIHETFGAEETQRFLQACQKRSTYHIPAETETDLSDALFCAVVGKERLSAVINSVYRTDSYFLDTCAARSFGAVQDHRAKTGSSSLTLLFSDRHPLQEADLITKATGLSQRDFPDKCRII